MLCALRFVTGLAIGAVLSPMVIMTEEFASERRKNFCLGLMSVGVPIGGMLGGSAAMILLDLFDWRAVFVAGSVLTSLSAICVYLFLPESVPFLMARRPHGYVASVQHEMARFGHRGVEILPSESRAPGTKRRLSVDREFVNVSSSCASSSTATYLLSIS